MAGLWGGGGGKSPGAGHPNFPLPPMRVKLLQEVATHPLPGLALAQLTSVTCPWRGYPLMAGIAHYPCHSGKWTSPTIFDVAAASSWEAFAWDENASQVATLQTGGGAPHLQGR